MNKHLVITKDSLVVEKISGKYSCPHYVPPSAMEKLLKDLNVSADFEAKKMLAEVAENFAVELVKEIGTRDISKESIIDCARNIKLI